MKTNSFLVAFLCLNFLFYSCGSDDDGPTVDPIVQDPNPDPEPEPEPEVLSGVFLDSAVEGLTFETATQSGTTDSNGTFMYLAGESITFSVGDILLGSAPGQDEITPITLAQQVDAAATVSSPLAANIAAFLQTLDADSDQSNGITITEGVVANLGISSLDFSQPIESILADIVLNVAKNEGSFLTVVPAHTASQNMAASLGVEFDGEENLTFSHFMPWLKTYFASTFNQNVPASAVYKNTLNVEGQLTATDITLRYSGRTIFALTFDSFNEAGLPNRGVLSFERAGLPFGTFPPANETMNEWEISYDGQNRVMTLQETQNGFSFEPLNFSGHDEQNRPLTFNQVFESEDGSSRNSLEYTFSFEDGYLATETSTFDNSFTSDDFSFNSSSTNNYLYSYNGEKNFDEVTLEFESTYEEALDGDEFNSSSTGTSSFNFSYGAEQRLETINRDTNSMNDEGSTFSSSETRTYDGDEILVSRTFENDSGFTSETIYTNGVAVSSTNTFQNLINREEEYFADGSRTIKQYFYGDDDILVEVITTELDANFIVRKETFEFFMDGEPSFTYVDEYDANGVVIKVTGLNGDGSLSFIDSFEGGLLVRTEFYSEGVLSSSQEFSYDGNGFINQVIFKDAEGVVAQINNYTRDALGNILTVEGLFGDESPWFNETWEYDANGLISMITVDYFDGYTDIFFYEDGVLVRGEFYDDQGNLYDVIDYTTTGKAARVKGTFSKKSQQLNATKLRSQAENDKKVGVLTTQRTTQKKLAPRMKKNVALLQYLKVTAQDGRDHRKW